MRRKDLDVLLVGLSPATQAIYKMLSERGPLTASDMRGRLGRNDGLTRELRRLMELGLVQPVGSRRGGKRGVRTQAYEVVPLGKIEQARKRHAEEDRKRERPAQSHGERIEGLRKRERGGDASDWIRTRRRALELMPVVRNVDAMSYWDNVPDDEYEMVFEETVALRDWAVAAVKSGEWRAKDVAKRRKVEKMLDTNGRTPEEAAAFKEGAKRLIDTL